MSDAMTNLAQPVLVTGATGFIGRSVVEKLLSADIAVKALVLPHETPPSTWDGRVEVIRGSITVGPDVARAAEGASVIIHLAAVVGDWGDERLFREVTVEGSRHVFEQALQTGARVVLASSIVVYGDKIRSQACSEETGFGRALGYYSHAKLAQERMAWEYHQRGMKLVVVRPANVYGPGSGPWLRDVVDVLQSGAPGLVAGGDMNAGLTFVDNVADLILLAASAEAALGRAYNACDGLPVTWKQYFEDIAGLIGARSPRSIPRSLAALVATIGETIWKLFRIRKRPPVTREALNLVGSDNRIPIARAKMELGYEPRVAYAEGIQRIREALARGDAAAVAAPRSRDRTVFITGGSSGIGLATARHLARAGHDLVIFARNRDRLHEARDALRAEALRPSQRIHAVAMDVADNADVQAAIQQAVTLCGAPDILINCAGVGSGDYFENIAYEQFDQVMKTNVYGARNTVHAVLPFMKAKGAGRVVNIASVAGLIGMFGYTAYGTTKYALVGFSECLRSELRRHNIRVTLVCPPEVRTPLIEAEARTLPPEARAVKSMAGLLEPDDVARAIVRALRKKRFLVIPGVAAKLLYFNHRLSNGLLTRHPSDLIVSLVASRARRNGAKDPTPTDRPGDHRRDASN